MNKPQTKILVHEAIANCEDRIWNKRASAYNQCYDDLKQYFIYLLSKIPDDEKIEALPAPEYGHAYYQGKFDLLMDLIHEEK